MFLCQFRSTYSIKSSFSISFVCKGQLISKCPFGVIVWTKIPTKRFDKFCPRIRNVVKS